MFVILGASYVYVSTDVPIDPLMLSATRLVWPLPTGEEHITRESVYQVTDEHAAVSTEPNKKGTASTVAPKFLPVKTNGDSPPAGRFVTDPPEMTGESKVKSAQPVPGSSVRKTTGAMTAP